MAHPQWDRVTKGALGVSTKKGVSTFSSIKGDNFDLLDGTSCCCTSSAQGDTTGKCADSCISAQFSQSSMIHMIQSWPGSQLSCSRSFRSNQSRQRVQSSKTWGQCCCWRNLQSVSVGQCSCSRNLPTCYWVQYNYKCLPSCWSTGPDLRLCNEWTCATICFQGIEFRPWHSQL
jgi:hypothetical protein